MSEHAHKSMNAPRPPQTKKKSKMNEHQKRYVSVSRMNNENNGGERFEVGLESVFPTLMNQLTVDG